jgi:hypothetical protein
VGFTLDVILQVAFLNALVAAFISILIKSSLAAFLLEEL